MDVWIGLGIGAVTLIFTIIGFVIAMTKQAGEHGREMQALKSENEKQDIRLVNLKENHHQLIDRFEEEKNKNNVEHIKFFETEKCQTTLANDILYIKVAIQDVKNYVEKSQEAKK